MPPRWASRRSPGSWRDSGPADPMAPGTVLRIEGERLQGTVTRIRLGDLDLPVPAAGVPGRRSASRLPATVRAGLHSLQVQPPATDRHAAGRARRAPNPNAGAAAGPAGLTGRGDDRRRVRPGRSLVSVPVAPAVGRGQRVVLLLNELQPPAGRPARAYAFTAPLPDAGAPRRPARWWFRYTGWCPGTYLVRRPGRWRAEPAERGRRTGGSTAPRSVIP